MPLYTGSFTNRSLYTAFAQRSCFGKQPIEKAGVIDNDLGLDRLNNTAPETFWTALRERLHTRGKDMKDWRDWNWPAKILVVVTGEAAHHPEFLSAVKDMTATLPKILSAAKSQEGAPQIDAELVIPEDPVSAPATGAALWSRLRVESGSYCETEDCSPPFQHLMPADWGPFEEKDEFLGGSLRSYDV